MNTFSKASGFYSLIFSLLFVGFLACSKSGNKSDTSAPAVDKVCDSLQTPTTLNVFALTEQQNTFFDEATKLVRDLVPEPFQIQVDEKSLIDRGGARHIKLNFALSGIPLCQYEAKVHSLKDTTYIDGPFPDFTVDQIPDLMVSDPSDLERILSALHLKGSAEERIDTHCLVWNGKELVSALEVQFQVKDLPYYALITTDSVIKAEARFFDASTATEQSQVFVKSPSTSTHIALSTITLPSMSSGGSLCSAKFQTVIPTTATRAFATNNEFFFATSDQRFKETSLFTNATTHSNWFLSLGILKAWPGPKVNLYMDGTNNFVNNTSVYIPESSGNLPTIKVGGGDGVNLQNLYIDYDVVSHELGHHIVYQTMTTTSGESLVLHEGLADFFVFADTGYPCLGNLICPAGSQLCYSAECLRTGLFPLTFTSADLPTEAHKKSQVISSLLWDIGNGNTTFGITGIGLSTLTKDVLKAVDFLPSSAQYTDFISALMKADKNLNNSANCSTIQSAANARGLTDKLASANVSCSNF